MSNTETKALMKALVVALDPIIRNGVEVFDANGQPTGKMKIAPASYFAVAHKVCAADGVTASDEDANNLEAAIAAATGQKFTPPKQVTHEEDEVE